MPSASANAVPADLRQVFDEAGSVRVPPLTPGLVGAARPDLAKIGKPMVASMSTAPAPSSRRAVPQPTARISTNENRLQRRRVMAHGFACSRVGSSSPGHAVRWCERGLRSRLTGWQVLFYRHRHPSAEGRRRRHHPRQDLPPEARDPRNNLAGVAAPHSKAAGAAPPHNKAAGAAPSRGHGPVQIRWCSRAASTV
jgi:hypothetical protein